MFSSVISFSQFSISSSYAATSSVSISSSVSVSSSFAKRSSLSDTASYFSNAGPNFIDPVTVYSSTLATAFLTFDAAPYVPAGTKVVILDAWTFNAATNASGYIYIRKDLTSPSYVLAAYFSAGGGDAVGSGGQGCFPISALLTFQYSATQASDGGIFIRLIGYF